MFDVGFWELALIGIVALLIIGPERLPGAAHTAGLWVGKGRRMLRDVKSDIDRELREQNVADLAALKKDIQSAGEEFKDATQKVGEAADVKTDVEKAAASLKESFAESSPAGKDEPLKNVDAKDAPAKKVQKKKVAKKKSVAKKTVAKKTPAKKAVTKKSAASKKNKTKTTRSKTKKTAETGKNPSTPKSTRNAGHA